MNRNIKTIPVLFVAVYLLVVLSAFNMKPELGDEGVLAMDAWRITRGEIPHRDFFQFIPPGAAYVQALFFKLFGASVFSVRLLGMVYSILLLGAAFVFFRRFLAKDLFLASSLSMLAPFGVAAWLFGSHHWLCDILQLYGAALLLSSMKKNSRPTAALSGLLLGAAVFSLQDQGGYLLLALAAGSLLMEKGDRKMALISLGVALGAMAAASLPFALAAGPGKLYHDWVHFPLFSYHSSSGHRTTLSSLVSMVLAEWDMKAFRAAPVYAVSGAVNTTFVMLTPVLLSFALIAIWIRKMVPRRESVVLTALSLSFMVTAFHRLSVTNLLWAFGAFLPVFVLLEKLSASAKRPLRTLAWSMAGLLLAVSLARSFSMVAIAADREKLATVSSRAGSYTMLNRYKGDQLGQIIGEIENRVPAGETMFCVGYVPLVNFMTQNPNPTDYNFMVIGSYYTLEQGTAWRREIEKSGTRWGLSERKFMDEDLGRKVFPNFRIAYGNESYLLWERVKSGH